MSLIVLVQTDWSL